MPEPTNDTMAQRIEDAIRDLALGRADLAHVQVFYRGEPSPILPVELYPLSVVTLPGALEVRSARDGVYPTTGFTYYERRGYLAFEVIQPDADAIIPDEDRRANTPSYDAARQATEAGRQLLEGWDLATSPVVSQDGRELTILRVLIDGWTVGPASRPTNYTNRGQVDFHLFTRRTDY